MSAIKLREQLINRISVIDDVSFLKAIKTILDTRLSSQILQISEQQRDEIIQSKKDIEQGFVIEQSELDQKFEQWLNEK